MRACPKCHQKYDDTDFRTMCAGCMVSLVPYVEEKSPLDAMAQAGPISVGPRLSPTVPPEVPQIPPTVPVTTPEPAAPPFTPAPDPDLPQPTIVPTPEPQPQPAPTPTEPLGRATAPDPVPSTLSMPGTTPRAMVTVLDDIRSTPTTAVQTPTPKPTPPKEQAAEKQATKSYILRRLTEEEISGGKMASVGLTILGGIIGFIAMISLFNTNPDNFGFFSLLCNGGMIVLAVAVIRAAVYRSAIQSIKITAPAKLRPGAPLRLDVNIGVLRSLHVTEGALTITGQERAVRRGQNSTTSRHTFFSRTIPVSMPTEWPAGQMLEFHPQVTLPLDTMPSFTGKNNFIEWSAALWIGIPGKYPDIRQRKPLTIEAVREGDTLPSTIPQRYALPNISEYEGTLTLDCAIESGNVAVLPLGQKIPFKLEMQPKENANDTKVWVELSYAITGSGDTERVVVDRVRCFRNGWQAGTATWEEGVLTLPRNHPITYAGTHLRVDWVCTVRVEVLWQRTRQQSMGVRVVPDVAN